MTTVRARNRKKAILKIRKKVFIYKKTFKNIAKICNANPKIRNSIKFQESAIREKSGGFGKNPNPNQKLEGLQSLFYNL